MSNIIIKSSKNIKLDSRSKYLRQLIIDCLEMEGRGHIGAAFSLVEIIRTLYDYILKFKSKKINYLKRDRFILSKGHGCLALYAMLYDKGFIKKKVLLSVGKLNSILGGHPEHTIPGVEVSTGALGHGYPFACGMALAARIKKEKHFIFTVMGDGEINEGSVWETALSVSKHNLLNLITIIDFNKLQSYGLTKEVSDLHSLKKKWESFGFKVFEVNGHSIIELRKIFILAKKQKNKPVTIICHTVKGKGLSFAEGKAEWHHKSMITQNQIQEMKRELYK